MADGRVFATESTLRRAFAGTDSIEDVVRSGQLGRRALRRLWRGVKKQVACGQSATLAVAGLSPIKPAQADLLFCVEVADGPLSTGQRLHAAGWLPDAALARLAPADVNTMRRWVLDLSVPGGVPRAAPPRLTFGGVLGMRHCTSMVLDQDVQYCDACLRPAVDLRVCARCQVATFCDAACQRAAWPAHKAWCSAAAALPEGGKATHAMVPRGKVRLQHTLLMDPRGEGTLSMQRHAQMLEIRKMAQRGLLPAMTPAQMERLRAFLVTTGGELPSASTLHAVLGPAGCGAQAHAS